MIWGYAGVWYGEYLEADPDPFRARLKFLVNKGFRCTGASLQDLASKDPAERDWIIQFLAENNLGLTLRPKVNWIHGTDDEANQAIDESLDLLAKCKDDFRCLLVTVGAGRVHRFMRDPDLPTQLERLSTRLGKLARGVETLGLKTGIENHGDYYISDLVQVCEAAKPLGIFLDTGNTYLCGEAPLPAFKEAVPYVVGSHFKDHFVTPRPDTRPLSFQIQAAVLGEGDVPLKACYDLLIAGHPDPDSLVMEFELIPPRDRDPMKSMDDSIAFVQGLDPQCCPISS